MSEGDSPTRLSTSAATVESTDTSSQNMATSRSDSITDSSNSSNNQDACKDNNKGNSPNDKASTSPGRFISLFDSMERLGKGGYGNVFKAREKMLEKYFAVKIVSCEEKALKEVKALAELQHPNIVRYYTCWMEDSFQIEESFDSTNESYSSSQCSTNSQSQYLYIQMELCNSKTLTVWINEVNAQSKEGILQDSKRREESLKLAQQIVSGVEYIHSMKLIHRDLKPDNIMFGLKGNVKIGDFGLVTADNVDDENDIERTVDKGTSSYMAPEQKSEISYDRKVDIFALGLIYFELLWKLNTAHEKVEIWTDVRSKKLPPEFAPRFPREYNIIMSMLCVKPEDRPEASKVKTALDECERIFTEKMCQNNHTV
ncbi:hypothetical protein LDENG_00020980 [Lucifuga dentata]|nr:hypothetical protein LDENG_00020980 [Lucifuga dentata]